MTKKDIEQLKKIGNSLSDQSYFLKTIENTISLLSHPTYRSGRLYNEMLDPCFLAIQAIIDNIENIAYELLEPEEWLEK